MLVLSLRFGGLPTRDEKMDDAEQNEAVLQEETQPDEDLRIDRIEDVLVAILKEFLGDRTTNQESLRTVLLEAIDAIKETINTNNVNVADVQVTRLEEQIFLLRKEVNVLKTQLNRLNAIASRMSNVFGRLAM
ncbi:hypothetical protein GOP47_0013520 [Adiantum capillus-veneris]|uniref:Uncharacterized protein n=1 Tax=Adiantum capillus-veneris TaxID=13818 RepID=A0A9D4UNP1_ADICA|nr:hypothetical protein GOP47_0013520 [Adiantum capillus-veneris]